MRHISEHNNFIFLLFALVFFLLLGAIVEQMQTDMGQLVVTSSTVVMLAIGVWSFKASRRRFWCRYSRSNNCGGSYWSDSRDSGFALCAPVTDAWIFYLDDLAGGSPGVI